MGMVYRQSGRRNWMIKYYRNGRPVVESAGTDKYKKAEGILKRREGDVAKGVPIAPGRLRFAEAAADVVNDYQVNGRRTIEHVERRIKKHLGPYFDGRTMSSITTADVRAFAVARLDAGASHAEINRELAILKRAFTLAVQAGRLFAKPHIPMLEEHNARQGFFEAAQFEAVRDRLPAYLHPPITFAYLTGWRIPSEVLTLEWSQVDLVAKVVRLEVRTTKNQDGRVFPFDLLPTLERVLREQEAARLALRREGVIIPWVFHRNGKRIRSFYGAWDTACTGAGCPGRIPHDFRRTAVRNLVRAGVPERVAMQLTGHKTRSVFDRYHIVPESDLREAAGRLHRALTVSVTVSATGSE